jgi:hypothetical protein
MDLASLISLVLTANVDPTTMSDISVDPEVTETILGRNLPSKKQAKAEAARKGEVKAPIHNKPAVFGVAMPERNTLDAKGFLMACRDAGKRGFEKVNEVTGEVSVVVKRDESMVREDLISAIHAYVGFDKGRDFGSQDFDARTKANREASGRGVGNGPTREEARAAARSMSGFVAGMPLPAQKLLANLKARETAAVDAYIDAKTEADKAAHQTMLTAIRKAIAELVW